MLLEWAKVRAAIYFHLQGDAASPYSHLSCHLNRLRYPCTLCMCTNMQTHTACSSAVLVVSPGGSCNAMPFRRGRDMHQPTRQLLRFTPVPSTAATSLLSLPSFCDTAFLSLVCPTLVYFIVTCYQKLFFLKPSSQWSRIHVSQSLSVFFLLFTLLMVGHFACHLFCVILVVFWHFVLFFVLRTRPLVLSVESISCLRHFCVKFSCSVSCACIGYPPSCSHGSKTSMWGEQGNSQLVPCLAAWLCDERMDWPGWTLPSSKL